MPTMRGASMFKAETPIGQAIAGLGGLMFQKAVLNSPAAMAKNDLLEAQTMQAQQTAEETAQRVNARQPDSTDFLVASQAGVTVPAVREYHAYLQGAPRPGWLDQSTESRLSNATGSYYGTLFAPGNSKVNDIATAVGKTLQNQQVQGAVDSGDYDHVARVVGAFKGNPTQNVQDGYQVNLYDSTAAPVALETAKALTRQRDAAAGKSAAGANTERARQELIAAQTATEGERPALVRAQTEQAHQGARVNQFRAATEMFRPDLVSAQTDLVRDKSALVDEQTLTEPVRRATIEAQGRAHAAKAAAAGTKGGAGGKPATAQPSAVADAMFNLMSEDAAEALSPEQKQVIFPRAAQYFGDPASPTYKDYFTSLNRALQEVFPGGPRVIDAPGWFAGDQVVPAAGVQPSPTPPVAPAATPAGNDPLPDPTQFPPKTVIRNPATGERKINTGARWDPVDS